MNKYWIIPVLVMALVAVMFTPPAQADLVTITVVLVAAFGAAVVTAEVSEYLDEKEATSRDSELAQLDNNRYALVGM